MSKQQNQTATRTETEEASSGPDDSEPSPERQAELRKVYEANITVGKPPYEGAVIHTRGEIAWIVRERGWRTDVTDSRKQMMDFRHVDIAGADLNHAQFRFADLSGAVLRDSSFNHANFAFANLSGAVIEGCRFRGAEMSGVSLSGTRVFDGDFSDAVLHGANLSGATIVVGNFRGANLTQASMDRSTVLGDSISRRGGGDLFQLDDQSCLLDVAWGGVVLGGVPWENVPRVGDEAAITTAVSRAVRAQAMRRAARAYHGLAQALEAQSIIAPALRYRRRQHQLERKALLHDFKLGQWLFSCALNLVSGYGDRPLRALSVYLAVVLSFAGIYFAITTPSNPIFLSGSQPLQLHEAVVFSLSSFHGRGFFPSTISLGDPVAIIAAIEAVSGLFIELVLIATFTRRLFER